MAEYNFTLTDNLHQIADDWPASIQLNALPETAKAYKKAPVNWNKMSYAFTRNSKYYGLFPTFTAQIGFTNGYPKKVNFAPDPSDGAKSWIDNIIWVRGINGEINVIVSAFNPQTHQFEDFIRGMGNQETVSMKPFQTDLEIISPLFIQDLLNKDTVEFDYQQTIDSYSNPVTGDAPKFDTLRIFGYPKDYGGGNEYVDATIVYPFQLFERIIALMTGQRNAFHSSVFGKKGNKSLGIVADVDENGDPYTEDGEGAYDTITTGRFIRGYKFGDWISGIGQISFTSGSAIITGHDTLFGTSEGQQNVNSCKIKDQLGNILGKVSSIDSTTQLTLYDPVNFDSSGNVYFTFENVSDNATLILSFEKLFKGFPEYCLGMTVKSNNNGNNYVLIEKVQTFYDNHVVAVITDPKDLEITFDEQWRHNKIEVGYNKYQKNENNNYGNSEYNNKSIYSVPTKFVKKSLTLTSDIRTDTTGIQLCLDNLKSGDDAKQNEFDNEIFRISAYITDEPRLISRNNHNINVASGSIYGYSTDGAYSFNLEKSPARIIMNNPFIRVMLDGYPTNVLSFQKAEELTRLSTKLSKETGYVSDCVDISISKLATPFLSGYKIKFNSPFGISEILKLRNNPFGLIKFWDYINNVYRYGWIQEVSSEPIDKKTNWELTLCSSYVTPIERKWKLKMLNGKYFQLLGGGDILLINQN